MVGYGSLTSDPATCDSRSSLARWLASTWW